MITKPTVLVLGAGTSIPYGYPSGTGLLLQIYNRLESLAWKVALNVCGLNEKEIMDFRSELNLSQQMSIDAFLEHRQEFKKIGKLAITFALMELEDETRLFNFDVRDKGIFHYLLNRLSAKWEDVRENKLSIITFNYDRALEHFLFTSLKHSYNKPDEEIAQALSNIPIIHVHGWLGDLPWQGATGKAYTPIFSEFETIRKNPKSAEAMSVAKDISLSAMWSSSQINIVSEAQPQTEEFTKAQELLNQAERIYFLGFGYHPTNLERLGVSEILWKDIDDRYKEQIYRIENSYSNDELFEYEIEKLGPPHNYLKKKVFGSALGLGHGEMEAIQDKWYIRLPDNTSDALHFLKEYADLS